MDEYALTFFLLIEESLKLDGSEYLILSQVSVLPHLKKNEAKKVLDGFQEMVQPAEMQSDIVADRKRLRKLLAGRKIAK